MGRDSDELKQAGVLLDLAGLLPSAEGRRVKFAGGNRTVIDGPFAESKQLVAGDWILQVRAMGGGRGMGVSAFGGGSAARSPTSMAPGKCAAR
jgi:hypothetical protein